jgi:hypothetical protein
MAEQSRGRPGRRLPDEFKCRFVVTIVDILDPRRSALSIDRSMRGSSKWSYIKLYKQVEG